ncbi:MAG: glycosyltransferase family 2 protein [bacterium]
MSELTKSLSEWESAGIPEMLSVVIPAHNEEGHVGETVRNLVRLLSEEGVNHEILIINDGSSDRTEEILTELQRDLPSVRYLNNEPPNGYGFAVRHGLAEFCGDAVAVFMADGSDDPADLVKFYRKLQEGYDCVFGSRFMNGGKVIDYPWPKLALNRLGNAFIRLLFLIRYNDVTNAFKLFRREVIAGLHPLLSQHFNLTVELPLKSIVRGYRYAVVPNSWRNRREGISKFAVREMGSRYMFIILYCLLEKFLLRNDYRKHADDLHRRRMEVNASPEMGEKSC